MLNNSIVAKLLFQHYKPTLLDENTCVEYTCINGVFCYNQTLSNTSYCIHFMLVLFKVLILFQESPTYEFKPFTRTTNARLSLYLFISVYFQWHLQVCLVCSCRQIHPGCVQRAQPGSIMWYAGSQRSFQIQVTF